MDKTTYRFFKDWEKVILKGPENKFIHFLRKIKNWLFPQKFIIMNKEKTFILTNPKITKIAGPEFVSETDKNTLNFEVSFTFDNVEKLK
jgi:hypothetical protein